MKFTILKSDVSDKLITDYDEIILQIDMLIDETRTSISETKANNIKLKKSLSDLLIKEKNYRKYILVEKQAYDEIVNLPSGRVLTFIEKAKDFFKAYPSSIKTEEINELLAKQLRVIKSAIEEHALLPANYLEQPGILADKTSGLINYIGSLELVSPLRQSCNFGEAAKKTASVIDVTDTWDFVDPTPRGLVNDIKELLDDFRKGLILARNEQQILIEQVLDKKIDTLLDGNDVNFLNALKRAAIIKRTSEDNGGRFTGALQYNYEAILSNTLAPTERSSITETENGQAVVITFQVDTKKIISLSGQENTHKSVVVEATVETIPDGECIPTKISYSLEGL